jgi:hypothetical protein
MAVEFARAAQASGAEGPLVLPLCLVRSEKEGMRGDMHSGMTFHTVIGDIAYNAKGDRTSVDYVWKTGADGKITYVQE